MKDILLLESIYNELDKPVKTPEELAQLHKVQLDDIIAQLKIGMETESEHTSHSGVARKIALAHIEEDPKYYSKLQRMEESTDSLPTEIAGYKVIVKNGKRVIEGGVNISYKKLTKLPDFSSVDLVEGGFDCSSNRLDSLNGCPQAIGGSFECYINSLTSLKGCPQTVGWNFNCSSNKLTSLEGCPQTIHGNFYCVFNNLTSLKGFPAEVHVRCHVGKNDLGLPDSWFNLDDLSFHDRIQLGMIS